MAFNVSKDIIEEIRSRCDIVELIGTFVQLKRSGSNTFKGLCPFHQEKTPSFHVDSARQSYHCFGCGKGGDVFRFFMEKENVGFVDALHMLAARVGVVIPEGDFSPEEGRVRADARERLYKINAAFADFFHRYLVEHPESEGARYLAGRGIPLDVAKKFKIGLAPDDWTACLSYGRYLKFSDDELVASGVIRRKEDSGRCFDHFKGRLTFSIENEQGRVVGFSARSLEPKPLAGGKYINTPETPVFKKGKLLYALPLARKMMCEKNFAILCEGQLDTIAFHRAGWECAMAPQGTGFTEDQARILKRYTSRICLAFDADAAGQKAIMRAVELLLPLSMEISVLRIPGGKDPDELFAQGGAEAVTAAIKNAVPWLDVLCESLPERYDMSQPASLGRAAVEVAGYLKLVTNHVELEAYVRSAAARLRIREDALWAELKNVRRMERRNEDFRNGATPAGKVEARRSQSKSPAALLTLLELALNYDFAARQIAELVPPEQLPEKDPVCRAINLAVNCALNGEFEELPNMISDMLLEVPCEEVSRCMVGTAEYKDVNKAVTDSVAALQNIFKRRRYDELMAEMRTTLSADRQLELLLEIEKLSKEIKD
ncbi:MAG: DNA primase [Lentisphaeria bacterium]|nr:DNA primase [Lentisphaeria bacterium]